MFPKTDEHHIHHDFNAFYSMWRMQHYFSNVATSGNDQSPNSLLNMTSISTWKAWTFVFPEKLINSLHRWGDMVSTHLLTTWGDDITCAKLGYFCPFKLIKLHNNWTVGDTVLKTEVFCFFLTSVTLDKLKF